MRTLKYLKGNFMNEEFRCYVINLDSSKTRLSDFEAAFKDTKLKIERISAVDGHLIDIKDFSDDKLCQRKMGRGIQPGEVGCYLSHKKAIEQFLSTGSSYTIIFEDDAIPNEGFEKTVVNIIEKFLKHNNSAAAVNLGAMDFKYSSKVLAINDKTLRCTHRFPMLATAVLWTRYGAKKFLESSSPITMPYDNFLRYLFSGTNEAFSIQPPIVRFSGIESDIAARNENIRRSARNRSKLYFYRKQRRTIRDKISAIKGYFKWILKAN